MRRDIFLKLMWMIMIILQCNCRKLYVYKLKCKVKSALLPFVAPYPPWIFTEVFVAMKRRCR